MSGMENKKSNNPDDQRQASRLDYLRRREAQQLALEKLRLEREEALYKEEELTEREKSRRKIRHEMLDLAKKRGQETEYGSAYYVPDNYEKDGVSDSAARMAMLNRKYNAAEERRVGGDGRNWEQEQLRRSREDTGKSMGEEYELVEQNHSEFILEELQAGRDPQEALQKERQAREEAERAKVFAVTTKFEKIQEDRKKQPVFPYREDIIKAVQDNQVLILVGETGSGKTTQVTQYVLEAGLCGDKAIGCTQPRRVAAMSVATRVAEERGCVLGKEVGYSVRFDAAYDESTKLKYLTDGMLLRELLQSPDLAAYGAIMVDEAHERTLHTDVLFALLKELAKARPDLRLIIASATLDAKKFSAYFNDAPIFLVPGRRYPVDIYYTKAPESDFIAASVATVLQIHTTQPKGDILVFQPGQEDIEQAEQQLVQRMAAIQGQVGELLVLPIYANLPAALQARIFMQTPEGARKVVLATNIAETSLTIDGIVYVIDPGFCKSKSYSTKSAGMGIEALQTVPVSKASAQQRAGRAGRVGPGKCFRLFTKQSFEEELPDDTLPEIQRSNLCSTVLLLKSLGVNNQVDFDFLDPPAAAALMRALEGLYALGALNQAGQLTALGRRMTELPLEPMLARSLIASEAWGCVAQTAAVCAMLSAGSVFFRPKLKGPEADTAHRAFYHTSGDAVTLLAVFEAWDEAGRDEQWCQDHFQQPRTVERAAEIQRQLLSMCKRVGIDAGAPAPTVGTEPVPVDVCVRRSLVAGFFFHAVKRERDNYRTVKNRQEVFVHPGSSLAIKKTDKNKSAEYKRMKEMHSDAASEPQQQQQPDWAIYFELVKTSRDYIRGVSAVEPDWLFKAAPHYFKAEALQERDKIMGRRK